MSRAAPTQAVLPIDPAPAGPTEQEMTAAITVFAHVLHGQLTTALASGGCPVSWVPSEGWNA